MRKCDGSVDAGVVLEGNLVLPSMPAAVQRLLQTIDGPRPTATAVAQVLAADAGLVAQALKIVNSAYYGLPQPIREIGHAVAYLGMAEIKRLALTVAVMDHLAPENAQEFQRFWYHAFHTALVSRQLARRHIRPVDTEELYVAALLHDVGKLVYMKLLPDRYGELLALCRASSVTLLEAERQLGGPSHQELGARLARQWGLPDSVARACSCHELPDLVALGEVADHPQDFAICVSNLLSQLTLDALDDEQQDEIAGQIRSDLGYDEEQFLALACEAYQLEIEVEQFVRSLGVPARRDRRGG